MKLAIIDNYDSFVHNLVRYAKESDCEVIVQRNDQINFSKLDECDAILLSPGPGIPSEAGDLLKVLERYSNNKKILGVCLGHQAIAEYFGGKIENTHSPVHGKASELIQISPSCLFDGIPVHFFAGRYHSWCVTDVPTSFVVTSKTSTDEIMSIEHVDLPIYGVQFHPESILTPDGRKLLTNWIKH